MGGGMMPGSVRVRLRKAPRPPGQALDPAALFLPAPGHRGLWVNQEDVSATASQAAGHGEDCGRVTCPSPARLLLLLLLLGARPPHRVTWGYLSQSDHPRVRGKEAVLCKPPALPILGNTSKKQRPGPGNSADGSFSWGLVVNYLEPSTRRLTEET